MRRQIRKPERVLAGSLAVALVVTQLALPPQAEASHLGSSTASAGSAPPPSVSAIQSFQPDLFTGRATTAIPLAVPPGRKGVQPSLGLSYSSSGRNGWLGVGWTLDAGYIERDTKQGAPRYDASDTHTLIFQGVAAELVRIPDGTYRAKDEGAFLRVEHRGVSGWEVRDKSGTRYFFGQTVASQVERVGQAFRWALDQVIDPHGNTLTISYTKDRQQLYLAQIRYTGHPATGLAPANQVDVLLEDRPDVETSYRSGFAVTTAKRLRAIETKATVDGALVLARRYELGYIQSAATGRSLLSSVTQVGTDGRTSLPPTTFAYTQDPPTYLHCHNCVPAISSGNRGWQVQVHVGTLFPYSEGGNDQRLWPGGGWEPGYKCRQEKVCRSRWYGTTCEHYTNCVGIPTVPWSQPFLELGGSSSGVSWSTDASGNLTANGPSASHLMAMTWLYTASSRTVSIPTGGSGRADVFYVPPGGSQWTAASGNQVPLTPGWTVVAVTAYNETGAFNFSISANLAGQVAAMNHAQFSPMGLAGDFNGDGYTDLAHLEPLSNHWHVLLNSGSGFGQEQTWLSASLPADTAPLVGDVDSDGKTDLILWNTSSGLWQVARSTGSGFANPATWHPGFGAGQTPLMGDFNGDQRLDVGTFSGGTWTVALSNGTSFGAPTTWLSGFGSGASPLTGDFNGDGFTDVATASGGVVSVALSNGTDLVPQPTAWATGLGAGQSLTSADLNGDGLTDAVYYDRNAGTVAAAFSTGQGFGQVQSLMREHPFELRGSNDALQVGDFRGNGLSGFGVFNPVSGAAEIAFALGTPPDLLEGVANGLRGATTLAYRPSSEFPNTNLHFAIPVVTQTSASDGLGHTYTTRYAYRGGLYDAPTKEFRGFQRATVTDVVGTTATTTFSQDLHTKGRPLSMEVRDAQGRLFTKTASTYSCTEPHPGVHFTTLDQTQSAVYDGDESFRQVRSRFTYDPYGNLTETLEEGQVDPPRSGDERRATATFTYNTADWILNKPSLTQTLDAAGTVVSQRRFFYDGAADPAAPPTAGLLTKEEEWLNLPAEHWLATTLTYDPYGNVQTVTDALGRATTNTYDAGGVFLTQIRNTLGHTRTLAYDPRTGQVLSSTDQNDVTTRTEYDTLGRVTKMIGPTDTAALPTLRYEYDLATVPAKTTVCVRVQSTSSTELCTSSFFDGLGRTIQTRSPAQDPAKQVVSGAVELDARGLVTRQWVAYLDAVSREYVPMSLVTGHSSLATVRYAYDALGRLIQTTDPDGSITLYDYNDHETTVTPPIGAQTQKTVDAYGRLIKVQEVLSETERHTTTYAYDALSNLAQVTDAKGHVTRIAYDSLGRKLGMDDPDMGRWTYAYDDVDNLTSQTDARDVTISFTYDELNRLTRKSYTIPVGSQVSGLLSPVSYTYDNPAKPFSIGKLTEIADGSGASSFEYDMLGRLTKESKTLEGTTYTIHRAYDLLGRLTALTYPDGDVATYTYNAQGGIETVNVQSIVQSPQSIVQHVDYNAAGQLTKLAYGNGTSTDYAYDPQTLRLSSLVTRHASLGTALQDFSYTFDALGNVTGITDRVHTASQTFQYDGLSRLTRATGAYGALAYRYDPLGNLIEKEGAAMTYGLPDGSKPHAVTSVSGLRSQVSGLSYDTNGNLIEKAMDYGLWTMDYAAQQLRYDAENRLIEVKTGQEETVTLRFEPGWNFFSLPVIPEDLRVTAVLSNFAQDFTQLAWFDANPETPNAQRFKRFVNHPKFNQFDTLRYGQGYQLYCKNPNGVTVTLQGKLPTQQIRTHLLPEWHLLPAVNLEPRTVHQAFGGLDADQVLVFDAAAQVLKPATEVAAGLAYFVHIRAAGLFAPSLPRDPTTRFVYDGDGGRVKAITPAGARLFLGQSYEVAPDGTRTKYVFAGAQRIAAINTPVSPQAALPPQNWLARLGDWIFGPSAEAAVLSSTISAEGTVLPSTIHFYHTDHLGSTNLITDGNGQVVELAEHTPYGAVHRRDLATEPPGHSATPFGFTGQRQDSGTGLILFPARAYDPDLGRFLQPDPFVQDPSDPQTLNRYAYVRNNPLTYVDPSGYFSWSAFFKGVFFAVVAFAAFALGAAVFLENPLLGSVFFAAGMWSANQSGQYFRAAFQGTSSSPGPPGTLQNADPFLQPEGPVLLQSPTSKGAVGPALPTEAAIAAADLPLESSWGPDDAIYALIGIGAAARAAAVAARELGPAAWAGLRSLASETGSVRLGAEGPTLSSAFRNAFQGVRDRTFKAGQRVYRSPRLGEAGNAPGKWFGTRRTTTRAGTESLYKVRQWGNPLQVSRIYEFTRDVTVHYGKVAGGKGYQIAFPSGLNPKDFLKLIDETLLR